MEISEELSDDELEIVAKAYGWHEIDQAIAKTVEEIDRAEIRLMYVAKEYELSNGLNTLKDIYAHRIRLLNEMIKAEEKKRTPHRQRGAGGTD